MRKFSRNSAPFFLTLILVNILSSTIVLSTFYINRSYFTENFCVNKSTPSLCCNATCYLNEALADIDTSKNTPQTIKLSSISFEYLHINEVITISSLKEIAETQMNQQLTFFDTRFLDAPTPPPRLS